MKGAVWCDKMYSFTSCKERHLLLSQEKSRDCN